MKRIGGLRRKSRGKLTKDRKTKGKLSVSSFLQTFKVGETVHLAVEPAYHKGTYPLRFLGKTGIVKAKKGRCYEVSIYDINKQKTLIVHPVHLRKS